MLQKWLESVGLAHVVADFEAHRIELADLRTLTEDDLREIGLAIGDRKRFRSSLDAAPATAATCELRPLTLVFVDLVGSSALGEALDIEDMLELLRAYRERSCAAISQYGGHVAHLLGDGILAYFGYPAAREDDCERAVRAAMEIAENVCRLETPHGRPLAVRCGIATGRVAVSDLFSGADRQTVTGSTANIAARLQTLAPHNGVILSEATAGRVSHLFNLSEMPEQRLKGFSELARPFQVISQRAQPWSPDDSNHVTAFVGRGRESEALLALWSEVRRGASRVVVLHGEPGMGKSRLCRRFLALLGESSGVNIMRFHASSLDQHSPLRPFLGFMRQRLGLADEDSEAHVAKAISALLADRSAEITGALEHFLAPDTTSAADDGVATKRRRVALDAIARLCAEEAALRPMVIVVEDAHWLDKTSEELLSRVVAASRAQPLLVVVTSRHPVSETLPSVNSRAALDIPIGSLKHDEVRQLVRSAFGEETVSDEVIAALAELTDGVPLFLEELLRPLLLSPAQADWNSIIGRKSGASTVPASLQEALAARLDALGRDKEIAQVAAVLGRSVDTPTLARLLGRPADEVGERLDGLCASGVLRRENGSTSGRYGFRHALLCDAAYDSLLRGRRKQLHLLCAEAMQAMSPVFSAERPEIVAWHLEEGGQEEASIPFWLSAGRAAAARSALYEARHDLERGRRIAAQAPQRSDIIETRLEFASLLGPVLFALSGPGAPESRAVYSEAIELAEAAPESAPHFAVLWGWWRLSRDFRSKHDRAAMLLGFAERRRDPEILLQAHHCNWASAFHAGELDRCRDHIENGLALYGRPDCENRPWLFGNHDARVCAHGELAQVLWMQGHPVEALAQERAARDWAERKSHSGTSAHAYDMTLLHRYYRRDAKGVHGWAQAVIDLADDCGMPDSRAKGHLFLGWALSEKGDPAAGVKMFEGAYLRYRSVGTAEDMPIYVCMMAEILNRMGAHDQALSELHEVRNELEKHGILNWAPEVWRLTGETMLRSDPASREGACDAFRTAARLAVSQQVPMLEMRALQSLEATAEGLEFEPMLARLATLRRQIYEPCPKVATDSRGGETDGARRPSSAGAAEWAL